MMSDKELRKIKYAASVAAMSHEENKWGHEDKDNPQLVTAGKDENGAFVYPGLMIEDDIPALINHISDLEDIIYDLKEENAELAKEIDKLIDKIDVLKDKIAGE